MSKEKEGYFYNSAGFRIDRIVAWYLASPFIAAIIFVPICIQIDLYIRRISNYKYNSVAGC